MKIESPNIVARSNLGLNRTEGTVASVIEGPKPGEFVITDADPTSASAFE